MEPEPINAGLAHQLLMEKYEQASRKAKALTSTSRHISLLEGGLASLSGAMYCFGRIVPRLRIPAYAAAAGIAGYIAAIELNSQPELYRRRSMAAQERDDLSMQILGLEAKYGDEIAEYGRAGSIEESVENWLHEIGIAYQ